MAPRSIIIHGHYYQPPREHPWLEEVEAEPSAAPWHDWNERIEQDCYRAVAAARIPGPTGRIARLLNLYEWTSFNFGPTLLEWLEKAAPDTYAAILEADRASASRLGHGNALAMPYHHVILPLSSRREKETEVRWGLLDFERRFGRPAEGMWLPETAVDQETLDVLAEAGVRFTVVAPHQVERPPADGLPGSVRTSGGRTIALFVYDGPLSHDVAFGPLVRDAGLWVERLLGNATAAPAPLITVATDGETYGHHHRFAEMALARVVEAVRGAPDVRLDNFASFLARQGQGPELTLVAPSSWSCTHGVERWQSDCGCRIATDRPPAQAWRAPLRRALAGLAEACHRIFDEEAPALFADPAAALAEYGRAIGAGAAVVRAYADDAMRPGLDSASRARARELLELERGALRSLTSCAWFFDDIGGLEAMQVLRYAAWVTGRIGPSLPSIEVALLHELELAKSGDPAVGTGRDIYLRLAGGLGREEARVAAGLAAARQLAQEASTSDAWEIEGSDSELTLVNRRTGRQRDYTVLLESEGLTLEAGVGPRGQEVPAFRFTLADLPERQRLAVAARLRRHALPRLLAPGELEEFDHGAGITAVVRAALVRRVRRLRADATGGECRDLGELLEILAQLGQTTPFEVQSLFYHAWQPAGAANPCLTALARQMGFETTFG